ncbi:ras-related protein Rab-10 isoform X4 [Zonotrichia albicollis]|uniref:ras-related protein Rab-10 isoform X4 n=1 Tax=Zonotrichia albicollis TaxID=44394 RepID=UPI003D811075
MARLGPAAESRPLLVKIVMAGESCVGKTSIVRRYTEPGSPPAGSPATSYMATIASMKIHQVEDMIIIIIFKIHLKSLTTYTQKNGIDFKVKPVMFNDTRVKLQIWDTAGQERFHTLSTSYFRGAQGFVLVYDITNLKSFQSITIWINDIYEKSGVLHDLDVVSVNETKKRTCCGF